MASVPVSVLLNLTYLPPVLTTDTVVDIAFTDLVKVLTFLERMHMLGKRHNLLSHDYLENNR